MAKTEEVLTQLATRIPKELHRRLKLHCVTNDIAVMEFVVEAIEEKLARRSPSPKPRDTLTGPSRYLRHARYFNAHGLRHTHAAELGMAGKPSTRFERSLGHASLAVTSTYLARIAPTPSKVLSLPRRPIVTGTLCASSRSRPVSTYR